ncbi:MAG TPA: dockerin type I domain-containing protein [Candidatus Krumholzibacteria bacterium]|nr:dockerin type I domain-containing protein [Candidatus Krumholzibacteria bacterium]HPD70423.1 dockerin type I domain-containing protein [Candidatus Krumholzibacteria bacterium]HRY39877.1 dockerin type I domain-containing protein [Candidatus Krumholzibacteria bacterium]
MFPRLAPGFLLACLASLAMAGVPDLNLSTATMDPAANGASVWNLPGGSGSRFDEAFAPGGATVNATITLTLIDTNGDPIANYPAEDIWLETSGVLQQFGSLVFCTDGTVADADTDENGQTLWLQALKAGGYTIGETVIIIIAGSPLAGGGLLLVFNSADINGDLVVNLSDIVAFTQLLGGDFSQNPEFAGDFNNDGTINLSDIVRMVQGIGTNCS